MRVLKATTTERTQPGLLCLDDLRRLGAQGVGLLRIEISDSMLEPKSER